MLDLSCPDWEERIAEGRSLLPDIPLFEEEAEIALAFFDELHLPDVPDQPTMREACGDWYRDLVRVIFGSRNPQTNERLVRELFALVPKGQSKTTYSAGLLLTAMFMNIRKSTEMLFIAPTQKIAETAFSQAVGMINADQKLKDLFKPRLHKQQIDDLMMDVSARIKTFDVQILTGTRPVFVLLDEIHLLGRNAHAAKVIRQIRGGLEKNSEGFFVSITTQSDDVPAGVFRDELATARKIRDGKFRGKDVRATLPILYEFPPEIARDPARWQDPDNWHMVMPNLGRSMRLDSLIKDWATERDKGEKDIRIWASQHLNIEIGVGLRTDAWAGAEFWDLRADDSITLEALLDRCEAIVVGIDGGGLDDLFGLTVLWRERGTRDWLSWSKAWCHEGVLDRRQSIASRLHDFAKDGDLIIVDDELQDVSDIVDIVALINARGLLAGVGVDPAGLGELVDTLVGVGVTPESGLLIGVSQGFAMMNAIKTSERKLASGTLRHAPSRMMDWCVANLKIEPTATAIRATKQNAGDAKIDPAMALFDAVSLMVKNPEPAGGNSGWDTDDLDALEAEIEAEMAQGEMIAHVN
jgi:phage terminase large subunit-like protein